MANNHPKYGTCPACTQGKGVSAHGRMKPHKRTVADGNVQYTVECAGGGQYYTELENLYWDAGRFNGSLGAWKKFPVLVPVMMIAIDGTEDGNVGLSMAYHSDKHEQVLKDWDLDSIKVYALQQPPTPNVYDQLKLELRQDGKDVLKSAMVDNDGGSPHGLILKWLEAHSHEQAAAEVDRDVEAATKKVSS